jgi:pimeloyl-ACP methyl ester carboxylesterase
MTPTTSSAGYFPNGMPYNRLGHGPKPLVVFQGLMFENKPQAGMSISMYNFLKDDYTVYVVLRKPGMPQGYSIQDMANDYAELIREEFGGPLDLVGVSTGGSIVLQFSADHPELVRKLVVHSSAYTLSDSARLLQLDIARLASEGKPNEAAALMVESVMPQDGLLKMLSIPIVWLASRMMSPRPPGNISDLVVTVEAEDKFDLKERLREITAPTLVIAGTKDPFYTPELFRQTAEGIPNARLVLYEGMGHPASGKEFKQEVLAFLR